MSIFIKFYEDCGNMVFNIYAKLEKCSFHCNQVEFWVYGISSHAGIFYGSNIASTVSRLVDTTFCVMYNISWDVQIFTSKS